MKRLLLLLVALVLLFSLSACGSYYSQSDIEVLKEHAYTAGYNAGRSDGFRSGYEDGLEAADSSRSDDDYSSPDEEDIIEAIDLIDRAQCHIEELASYPYLDLGFDLWDVYDVLEAARNRLR